jgi:hypothetical protein
LILNQEDVAVNAYPEIINEKTNDFLGLMAWKKNYI